MGGRCVADYQLVWPQGLTLKRAANARPHLNGAYGQLSGWTTEHATHLG